MATAAQRRGIPGVPGLPGIILPDGSISADDRRRIAGFYGFGSDEGGGEDGEVPPVVTEGPLVVFARVGMKLSVEFLPSMRLV